MVQKVTFDLTGTVTLVFPEGADAADIEYAKQCIFVDASLVDCAIDGFSVEVSEFDLEEG